jgi:hypothetical protein
MEAACLKEESWERVCYRSCSSKIHLAEYLLLLLNDGIKATNFIENCRAFRFSLYLKPII